MIEKSGSVVSWSVDGLAIARVDITTFATPTGGNNILFGRHDSNTSSSTDPNAPLLSFTLIDNIVVVPEPTAAALLCLAAPALLARRRPAYTL
ncbi:MAG: PEP-CTERM sorting domain-containing protein [Phycisphaerales bacterium]